MKHRNVELTETQERALELATERHDKRVHFAWYPKNAEWESEFTLDEFMQDADKVKVGEWLLLSWSGVTWVEVAWVEDKLTPERSPTYKHLPIWERIGHSEDKPLGHVCWKQVGYYNPSTGNLVIGD